MRLTQSAAYSLRRAQNVDRVLMLAIQLVIQCIQSAVLRSLNTKTILKLDNALMHKHPIYQIGLKLANALTQNTLSTR